MSFSSWLASSTVGLTLQLITQWKTMLVLALQSFNRSYIRGEQKKKSDVDILIDYNEKEKFSLFDLMDLSDHLSKLLGVNVDIALKRSLKTIIGYFILKEVVYI